MKITLIGAGSAVFSLSMIKDICLTPNLAGNTICVMDIDEERLENAYKLCKRYAAELGTKLELERTTSREEALKDAEFVVNTALVGGHGRMIEGIEIAKKYGYRYGSSYHVMHDEAFWINFYQFRLIEDVYLDVKKYCPDAWYILLANPVCAAITYLGRKYNDPKVVALCEGTTLVPLIFDSLGLERDKVSYEITGINHFVWMTKLLYKGEDAFPVIDKFIDEKQFDKDKHTFQLCPKVQDMYKTYGVLPIGDTFGAGGGAWGWWYHTDDATQEKWQEDPEGCWNIHFNHCFSMVDKIKQYANDETVKLTEIFEPKKSDELLIDLIESLACDIERKIMVCVMNTNEYVPGVPKNFNIETAAICSKKGIQVMQASPLPAPVLAHLLHDRVAPIEVELTALETGNKRLLSDLVMMDPWTRSREQATTLVDEILNLPWNTEMKEWYR